MPKISGNPFTSAILKVERAEKHISDLQAAILEIDLCRVFTQYNAESGESRIIAECASVPPAITLITGDAIHNLRTALDYLVREIAFAVSDRESEHIKFPIGKSWEKLVASLSSIRKARPDIADHIASVVKAYKGGNDALWTLHSLDIRDKHRLLIAHVQTAGIGGVEAKIKGGKLLTVPWSVFFDGRFCLAKIQGEIENYRYGKPTGEILFDEGEITTEPVIPTLLALRDEVMRVIDGVASL
jgi:hypothetical protein